MVNLNNLQSFRNSLRSVEPFNHMFDYSDNLQAESNGWTETSPFKAALIHKGMKLNAALQELNRTCGDWHLHERGIPNQEIFTKRMKVMYAATLLSARYYDQVHKIGAESFAKFVQNGDLGMIIRDLPHAEKKLPHAEEINKRAHAAAMEYYGYWLGGIFNDSWQGYRQANQIVQDSFFCSQPNITPGRVHVMMTRGFGITAPYPLRRFVTRHLAACPDEDLLITTNDWGFGCAEMIKLRADDENEMQRGIEAHREEKAILLLGVDKGGYKWLINCSMEGDRQLPGSNHKIAAEPIEKALADTFKEAGRFDPRIKVSQLLDKRLAERIEREHGRIGRVSAVDGFVDPTINHGFKGMVTLINEGLVTRNAGRNVMTNADWHSRTAYFAADRLIDNTEKLSRADSERCLVGVGNFAVPLRVHGQELAGYNIGKQPSLQ